MHGNRFANDFFSAGAALAKATKTRATKTQAYNFIVSSFLLVPGVFRLCLCFALLYIPNLNAHWFHVILGIVQLWHWNVVKDLRLFLLSKGFGQYTPKQRWYLTLKMFDSPRFIEGHKSGIYFDGYTWFSQVCSLEVSLFVLLRVLRESASLCDQLS